MPSEQLVDALRNAYASGRGLAGAPQGKGEKDPSGGALPADEPLTSRETEVVRLVARGMSNKAIANHLGISSRTVEGHLNHVFDKLGILSRTELVHYALAGSLFARGGDQDHTEDDPGGDR